jgi:hypothetical protein
MSRTGPPHYHQGSSNVCHCAYSEVYHHTSAPYLYPAAPAPQPPARPRPVAGHPSEYAPPVRRVSKPKPTNKISKSREMKFDEDSWQWYFETKEAPGVKWLETVRHIEDLPQAKDSDFVAMLNEYYICGHVIDQPDQDKLPVLPGGPGKTWRYKRAPPPPPVQRQPSQHAPPPAQFNTWIDPSYPYRHPAAPTYASGAAHPLSMRLPSGASHPEGWRLYSNTPPQEFSHVMQEVHPGHGQRSLGPLPGAPGPRQYVDASVHSRHYGESLAGAESDDGSYDDDQEDDEYEHEGTTTSGYYSEDPRSRAYIPPPSPKSRKRAQKLRDRGFRVVDPHTNVGESPW